MQPGARGGWGGGAFVVLACVLFGVVVISQPRVALFFIQHLCFLLLTPESTSHAPALLSIFKWSQPRCHYEGSLGLGWFTISLQVGLLLAVLCGWRSPGQFLMTHTWPHGRFALLCCTGTTNPPHRDSTPSLDCRVCDGHGGE